MKPLPHDLNLFSSYGKGVLFIPVLSVAIAKQVQAASLYYSVAVHQEPVHTVPAALLPFLCPFSFPVQSDPCRLWQDLFLHSTGVHFNISR